MKSNYFGYNLKFLRKSFQLSQQQMADIVGKTYTAVSRWEAGLREPSNKVVQTYREHFGVAPADLMYKPLDQQIRSADGSDLARLFHYVNEMNEHQFSLLLAYAEGLINASL